MTTKQLAECIGKDYTYTVSNGLRFTVECLDAKIVYGQIRLEVQPANGFGLRWVDMGSLKLRDGNDGMVLAR